MKIDVYQIAIGIYILGMIFFIYMALLFAGVVHV